MVILTAKPGSAKANASAENDVSKTSTELMMSSISAAMSANGTTPGDNTTNNETSSMSYLDVSSTTVSPNTTGGTSENRTSNTSATTEAESSTWKPELWWDWDFFTWEKPQTSTGKYGTDI